MRYYLYRHGSERLFEKKQLKMLAIRRDDLVKQEGSDSWIEAEKVDDLKDLFSDTDSAVPDEETFVEDNVIEPIETPVKVEDSKPVSYSPFNAQSTKKLKGIILGVVLLLAILALTNPSKSRHYGKMESLICTSLVNNGFGSGDSQFTMFLASAVVPKLVEKSLDWHDYGLFSYTSLKEEIREDRKIMSFGIFGQVFTISQDKMDSFWGKLRNNM